MEERIKSAQAEARVLADDKDSLEVQLTKLEQAMGRLTEEKDSEIEQKEVVAEQLADLEQIKAELDAFVRAGANGSGRVDRCALGVQVYY